MSNKHHLETIKKHIHCPCSSSIHIETEKMREMEVLWCLTSSYTSCLVSDPSALDIGMCVKLFWFWFLPLCVCGMPVVLWVLSVYSSSLAFSLPLFLFLLTCSVLCHINHTNNSPTTMSAWTTKNTPGYLSVDSTFLLSPEPGLLPKLPCCHFQPQHILCSYYSVHLGVQTTYLTLEGLYCWSS